MEFSSFLLLSFVSYARTSMHAELGLSVIWAHQPLLNIWTARYRRKCNDGSRPRCPPLRLHSPVPSPPAGPTLRRRAHGCPRGRARLPSARARPPAAIPLRRPRRAWQGGRHPLIYFIISLIILIWYYKVIILLFIIFLFLKGGKGGSNRQIVNAVLVFL